MNLYLTSVLVLTVGYVLYYAIIIAMDLSRKDESQKSDAEVIDVSDMDDTEESITVTESDSGFSVGDNDYNVSLGDTDSEEEAATEPTDRSKLAEKLAEIGDQMETIQSTWSNAMYSKEFQKALLARDSRYVINLKEKWTPTTNNHL